MAKLTDLDTAIASVQTALDKLGVDLTDAIDALQAAIGGGATNFDTEVASLVAIAAKLSSLDAAAVAAKPGGTVPPGGPPPGVLTAVPAAVVLSAAVPTQVVVLSGAVGAVTAVSSDVAVATVASTEPWVVTMVAPGTASVTFTDSSPTPQVLAVGVTAS